MPLPFPIPFVHRRPYLIASQLQRCHSKRGLRKRLLDGAGSSRKTQHPYHRSASVALPPFVALLPGPIISVGTNTARKILVCPNRNRKATIVPQPPFSICLAKFASFPSPPSRAAHHFPRRPPTKTPPPLPVVPLAINSARRLSIDLHVRCPVLLTLAPALSHARPRLQKPETNTPYMLPSQRLTSFSSEEK